MEAVNDLLNDRAAMETALKCILFGGGIIVCLGIYGVIQERVMSVPYDGELFKASVFLVFCNRLAAIVYAAAMVKKNGEEFSTKVPLWKYVAVSFSNVAATTCQYEALKWVSFPVQMLGKSFKMMPVMMWGILISGKKYKPKDWAIALGVTWGVTQFLLTGDISAPKKEKSDSVYGLILLVGFLACDSFTSTFQEKLFADHKTSKFNQMLYVNGASCFVSLGTLLATGNLFSSIDFCTAHPNFVTHAALLSTVAVSGQYFIYSMIKGFGALALAATMNMRQVISILGSYIIYSHTVSFLQVVGLAITFGCLFYKSFSALLRPKESSRDPKFQAVPQDDKAGAEGGASKPPHPAVMGQQTGTELPGVVPGEAPTA